MILQQTPRFIPLLFPTPTTTEYPLDPPPDLGCRIIPPSVKEGLVAVHPVGSQAVLGIDEREAGECEGCEGAQR